MKRGRSGWRRWQIAALLGLVVQAWGCAFTGVNELTAVPAPPPGSYREIVVGEITGEKLSPAAQRTFARGLQRLLKERGAFETVALGSEARPATASSLILKGEITEFTEGNRFLQWFIGFGAGASEAAGVFEVVDGAGKSLLRFRASSRYAGGLGIGGAALLSTDDLLDRLAEAVAEQVLKWARGEAVEQL